VYGDATLTFLRIRVHRCVAVMDVSHAVNLARVVQDAFGGRGFSCIDVRNDADVSL
jgi:hypothetical protein